MAVPALIGVGLTVFAQLMPKKKVLENSVWPAADLSGTVIHKSLMAVKYFNAKTVAQIEELFIDTLICWAKGYFERLEIRLDFLRSEDGINKPAIDIMGDTKLDATAGK